MTNSRTGGQLARTSTQRNSTIDAHLIKSIILDSPQQTTHFAHQLSDAKLNKLLISDDKIEKLFAHICHFARGNELTVDEFSKELLAFMQMVSSSPDHARYCLGLYKKAKHYLSVKLPNEQLVENEYQKYKKGAVRLAFFTKDIPNQTNADLNYLAYNWLCEIERSAIFAPQDAQILIYYAEKFASKPSSIINFMLGHLLARYQDTIHGDLLQAIQLHMSKWQEQYNASEFLPFLLHKSTCLSTGKNMAYKHSGFEIRPANYATRCYMEYPNASITRAVDSIIKQPTQLIDVWLLQGSAFDFHNLRELCQWYPALDSELKNSDNNEIKSLLAFIQFNGQSPVILNKDVIETALANTTDRLKKCIVLCYVSAYLSGAHGNSYHHQLHVALTDAVKKYVDEASMPEWLARLDSMRPRDYAEKVSEGLTAASTTVTAYVKPWAESVATQSSLLFTRVRQLVASDVAAEVNSIKNAK